MKKKLLAILAGLFTVACLQAQYATIPDSSFVNWLRNNGFSACMVGNTIDTNCTYVVNAHTLNCYAQPIHDLTGIQYFRNLDSLDCSNDTISNIPALPAQLKYFNCSYNRLTALPTLPESLISLYCNYNALTHLPTLPAALLTLQCTNNSLLSLPNLQNVTVMDCSNNGTGHWSLPALPAGLKKLTCNNCFLDSLPALPSSLQILYCDLNYFTTLPALPSDLQMLHCENAQLQTMPALPSTLTNFDCQLNHLTSLPALPESLLFLWCGSNQLVSLPSLPSTMIQLDCTNGAITTLPSLPSSLTSLYCGRNNLDSLPPLPSSITKLYCDHNQITHFPALPAGLKILYCSNNNLSTLPAIPASVTNLLCDHNDLNAIPELPDSLNVLQCSNNMNLYCLPQIKKINTLNFNNTNITCLPDYGSVLNSSPSLKTLPLCGETGHTGCSAFWNISGKVYFDADNNCVMDAGDSAQANVKVMLYDSNSLLGQVYTGGDGYYSFNMPVHGTYYIVVDTAALPFRVSCPSYGSRSVVITATDSMAYSQDFALSCRNLGFDLGVTSIINEHYTTRPAAIVPIITTAGDMSKLFGASCSAGVGGTVTMSISGPARYYGGLNYALTPTTWNGTGATNWTGPDTLTWNVSDFTHIVNNLAFGIQLVIDSTAHAGSDVCVTVNITPDITGDYNTSNNSLTYCFAVVSSLDPNTKEVSPAGDITAQDWLTYTIRFQNTGNAIAQNIVVMDTLDQNIDASTFQALASSSKFDVQVLNGNVVKFNFANINLPDSAIDQTGSHAYLQYKVLPKAGSAPGTIIQNTAYIYFDYNAAMATNTTSNKIAAQVSGLSEVNTSGTVELSLYPNPANQLLAVKVDNTSIGGTLDLLNTTGQRITELEVKSLQFSLPVSTLANGVYFVRVTNSKGRFNMKKLVIER